MDSTSERVLAVVVTHFPAPDALPALLLALVEQCHGVLVVDNTPSGSDPLWDILAHAPESIRTVGVCRFGRNRGVGAAFNLGLEVALQEGCTHVLLSDQDSLPRAGMVAGLLEAARDWRRRGIVPAAVGPLCVDRSSGRTLSFQCRPGRWPFYVRKRPDSRAVDLEVLGLISSGTLLDLEAVRQVGLFREDFFIDNVDMEWCLRARACSFAVVGTSRGVLDHTLGGEALRVRFFGVRREPSYGPDRLYFRFRNFSFMAAHLDHVPLWWSLSAALYWAKVALVHLAFAPQPLRSFSAIRRGVCAGLRGDLQDCDARSMTHWTHRPA